MSYELLSVSDAARVVGKSPTTIRYWTDGKGPQGWPKPMRTKYGTRMFSRLEIEAFAAEQSEPKRTKAKAVAEDSFRKIAELPMATAA